MKYKLRTANQKQNELDNHNNFTTRARELENTCKYMANISLLKLRVCHKVRPHLSLQHHDRTKTNFDNELQENFCSFRLGRKRAQELEKYCEELTKINRQQKAKVHSKFRSAQLAKVHCKLRNENEKDNELEKNFENMIFKKKLVPLLLDRHFALAASFQFYGHKTWKEFREASMEIIFYKMMRDKELRHQL